MPFTLRPIASLRVWSIIFPHSAGHDNFEPYLARNGDYQKAVRFGDAALAARLERYELAHIDRARKAIEIMPKLNGKMSQTTAMFKPLALGGPGMRMFVITEDCIARIPYHSPGGSVTWENCTLRKYLNTEFFNWLPQDVRGHIVEVSLPYPDKGNSANDKNTMDKVFLLSVNEARRYFIDDNSRIAKLNGETAWWWLRSPGIGSATPRASTTSALSSRVATS